MTDGAKEHNIPHDFDEKDVLNSTAGNRPLVLKYYQEGRMMEWKHKGSWRQG
jgi:hypothetical protein